MFISSIGSSTTRALEQVTAADAHGSAAAREVDAPEESGDTSRMSGPGQIMAKLKELQQRDPVKFKEVMQAVSDSLKGQASSSTDPQEQKALTQIAGQFAQAAQSGDLSALRPQGGRPQQGAPSGPPPGGGPPPAGKVEGATHASSTSSASATYDPADTNQDGTVSLKERQAYAAKQAASGAQVYRAHDEAPGDDRMAKVFAAVSAAVNDALGGE